MIFAFQCYEVIDREASAPAQLIEKCGRTCYKSESLITDDSADRFTRRLVDRGHGSVLEHAALAFEMSSEDYMTFADFASTLEGRFLNFSGPFSSTVGDRKIVSGNLWAWLNFMKMMTDKKRPG